MLNVLKFNADNPEMDWFFGIPEGMTTEEAMAKALEVRRALWTRWKGQGDNLDLDEFIAAMVAVGFIEINFEPVPNANWDEPPKEKPWG